jgi:hypothetical protein
MKMTAKEQALLTLVLDAKLNELDGGMVEARYQTVQVWSDLYDTVIDAEIEDEADYDDNELDDFLNELFYSEPEEPEADQFADDVAVVDAHMTALQGDDLEDDEKAMVAASFVNLMDNETAEMIFQAIADRWSEEARNRFNDFQNAQVSA